MATSNDEWDVGMQNGLRSSAVPPEHYEPGPPKGRAVGAVAPGAPRPGQEPGALKPRPPGSQRPGQGGVLKPGQPGPRPNRPGARPGVPDTRPGGPGARPTPGTTTTAQLARFEGARLKLRKAANGRYALGVDIELALDKAKPGQLPGQGKPGGMDPGGPRPGGQKPGGARPGGMKPGGRPQLANDDLEAFAVPDDLADDDATAFIGNGESDAAFAAGEEADGNAFGGEDQGEDEAYAAAEDDGEGEGDTAYAAGGEGEGEDDTAYAVEGDGEDDTGYPADQYDQEDQTDGDTAFAADAESAADAEDDGNGTFAAEAESAETAQWPNQLPVPKGVFAISQAPAIFETQETDADDEALSPQAAAKPARTIGTAQGMLAAAKKTIGMGEHPPGSNHNKITEWYNTNIARIGNGPWCNMAVTYWAGHSGNLPAVFAGRNVGYAYTVGHAQKFQQKGRWHTGVAGIRPGDVVFFDWRGTRSIRNIDHIGVVERVSGKRIVTIEGNTTGNSCRRMVRDARFIVGYGRPTYGNK